MSPTPSPPPLDHRWLHSGSQHLNLLSTPIPTSKSTTLTYVSFSDWENVRLERKWVEGMGEGERRRARGRMGEWKGANELGKDKDKEGKVNGNGNGNAEASTSTSGTKSTITTTVGDTSQSNPKAQPKAIPIKAQIGDGILPSSSLSGPRSSFEEKYPDPEDLPDLKCDAAGVESDSEGGGGDNEEEVGEERDYDCYRGVPVSQDNLFEVNLHTMSLFPVFWAHTGPRIPVIRATWFIGDEAHPCDWELGEELERGYLEIKPYLESYPQELQKAIEQGASAEEKLKHKLDGKFGVGQSVVFQDGECGQFVQTGMTSYLNKLFWTSIRSKPGGIMVYRGYSAALRGSGHDKPKQPSSRRGSHSTAGGAGGSRRGSVSSVRSMGTDGAGEKIVGRKSGLRNSMDFKGVEVDVQGGGGVDMKRSISEPTNTDPNDPTISVPPPAPPSTRKAGPEDVKPADHAKPRDGPSDKEREKTKGEKAKDALDEEQVPLMGAEEDEDECTDLILVVHGIGQQLATQWEGFNFVYATNMLRQVMRQQADNAALASIIRDRRVQILPIQWRASLQLAEKGEEDQQHGLDNRFTMADITLPKIPAIRQITNSVLLDIPLFMSQHRQAMIEAVCVQANKAYRKWCARNPDFDGKGRVHIIGHSLGSALAAHILSNQPTRMPPLADLPKQVRDSTSTQFLFNTSNLFLCGSPLGIFLHIDQAQIIPRRGRERTMRSPPDEALDRAGRFGCMSIDSLYNICHYADPVAYTLTATVDSKLARDRPPLSITSVTAPFYASVTDPIVGLSKYFDGIPFIGSGRSTPVKGEKEGKAEEAREMGTVKARKPIMVRLPSGIEMSGPEGEERLQGSRSERRLSALNPHGNIDFVLPSAGVSEYLDALTSHGAYWSDASFGAFLLAEIFSTKLDLLRTGMGLARRSEGTLGNDIPL